MLGAIKATARFLVELGTTTIVSYTLEDVARATVPDRMRKNPIGRVSLFAAKCAISFKAADAMGEYTESACDETAEAFRDIMGTLKKIVEEEDSKNGEEPGKDIEITTSADN